MVSWTGLAPSRWVDCYVAPTARQEYKLCATKSNDARNLDFYVKSPGFQKLAQNFKSVLAKLNTSLASRLPVFTSTFTCVFFSLLL
jgi:hypothetical protein